MGYLCHRFGGFGMKLGAELGGLSMWREGLWRKGLFPDNSKGKSEKLEYFVYKAKGNFDYVINANHTFELNAVAMRMLLRSSRPSFRPVRVIR